MGHHGPSWSLEGPSFDGGPNDPAATLLLLCCCLCDSCDSVVLEALGGTWGKLHGVLGILVVL